MKIINIIEITTEIRMIAFNYDHRLRSHNFSVECD